MDEPTRDDYIAALLIDDAYYGTVTEKIHQICVDHKAGKMTHQEFLELLCKLTTEQLNKTQNPS
jgi:hypothetical protein